MFHASEVDLEIGFAAAQERLISLARAGGLARASLAACEQAASEARVAGLTLGGLDGQARLLPAVTRVCHLAPVCRADVLTLPVRWMAAGHGGPQVAVLDADLTLVAVSARLTRLRLIGAYRLPPRQPGTPGAQAEDLAESLSGALLVGVASALTGARAVSADS